ncbi:MAG: hypothetical protein AABY22_00950 [Nanoarchaeota archaeon]
MLVFSLVSASDLSVQDIFKILTGLQTQINNEGSQCFWPPYFTDELNLSSFNDYKGIANSSELLLITPPSGPSYIDERLLCYNGRIYSTINEWDYFVFDDKNSFGIEYPSRDWGIVVSKSSDRIGEWKIVNDNFWTKKWISAKINQICPSDMIAVNDFCIDKNENSLNNWFKHAELCSSENKRLCSPSEWYGACKKSVSGLRDMRDDLELIDSMWSNAGQIIGGQNCESWDSKDRFNSFVSRCCKNQL